MERHLTDDELVLHYYGEMKDVMETRTVAHLDACGVCRAALARLQRSLSVIDMAAAPPARDGLEARVWARLQPVQPFRLKAEATGVASAFRRKNAAWAAAAAVLVLAAFVAGRMSADRAAVTSGAMAPVAMPAPAAHRVLTADLGDHLGRAELALTDFLAAGDESTAPATEDLIAANRLYRNTAMALGNVNVANVLDELERALIEISAAPDTPEADQQAVREWIDSRDLLFKVRVMREAPGADL